MGILLKKKRQREREREQYATMSGEKRSEINKKRRERYEMNSQGCVDLNNNMAAHWQWALAHQQPESAHAPPLCRCQWAPLISYVEPLTPRPHASATSPTYTSSPPDRPKRANQGSPWPIKGLALCAAAPLADTHGLPPAWLQLASGRPKP